jgi:hypothetical protein
LRRMNEKEVEEKMKEGRKKEEGGVLDGSKLM